MNRETVTKLLHALNGAAHLCQERHWATTEGPGFARLADWGSTIDRLIGEASEYMLTLNSDDEESVDGPTAGQCNDILGKPGHYR